MQINTRNVTADILVALSDLTVWVIDRYSEFPVRSCPEGRYNAVTKWGPVVEVAHCEWFYSALEVTVREENLYYL